jgi:LVIVD repeat-containing protein
MAEAEDPAFVSSFRDAGKAIGVMPGGGTVPFRLPAGALIYLDRNQYISNMEIIAYYPSIRLTIFGDEYSCMWSKGSRRLIAFQGGWVDITEPKNATMIGESGLGMFQSCVYNSRLRKWLRVVAHQMPLTPGTVEYPRGKYHAAYAKKAIEDSGFRGIKTYDVTSPERPVLLNEFETGRSGHGVHLAFYDGGQFAYLSCGWDDQLRMESSERVYSNGLMIVDMSDPVKVKEVSKWWVPGQRLEEEDLYRTTYPFAGDQCSWTGNRAPCIVPIRVEDGGTVGYGGWGHFGMYVHNLTDIRNPEVYGKVAHPLEAIGGIPYHHVVPLTVTPDCNPLLRNLAIAIPESLEADCREPFHTSYIIDVKDPADPQIVGLFPRPMPHPDAPYKDFAMARGRFSSRVMQHWIAPGKARPNVVALSYLNAGIRLFDISDPTRPKEVAYFVPPRDGEIDDYMSWRRGSTEAVFIEWDRNLIWVSTHAGLYCLSAPFLGKPELHPMAVAEWSVPHVNAGWQG